MSFGIFVVVLIVLAVILAVSVVKIVPQGREMTRRTVRQIHPHAQPRDQLPDALRRGASGVA
jgi:hypothetical protein